MANPDDGEHKPRPRYPSDDARQRVKPHVRIHHSVASHPRFAQIWADPYRRGMLVELWRQASVYGAAHTSDWLSLSPGQIVQITGRRRRDISEKTLRLLCEDAGYSLRSQGQVVEILVRNFAKKQNITPRLRSVTPLTPHSSPSPSAPPVQRSSIETSVSFPPETEQNDEKLDQGKKARIALLVHDIVEVTKDETPRSVAYFTRMAVTLGESVTRRLISQTRDAISQGGMRNAGAYFTKLVQLQLQRG